jgi:hypothetical protein
VSSGANPGVFCFLSGLHPLVYWLVGHSHVVDNLERFGPFIRLAVLVQSNSSSSFTSQPNHINLNASRLVVSVFVSSSYFRCWTFMASILLPSAFLCCWHHMLCQFASILHETSLIRV